MINLSNITLIGINGTPDIDQFNILYKIAKNSLNSIKFAKIKILTGVSEIQNNDNDIEIHHVYIPSYQEYLHNLSH